MKSFLVGRGLDCLVMVMVMVLVVLQERVHCIEEIGLRREREGGGGRWRGRGVTSCFWSIFARLFDSANCCCNRSTSSFASRVLAFSTRPSTARSTIALFASVSCCRNLAISAWDREDMDMDMDRK